jgi:hypothetical protein
VRARCCGFLPAVPLINRIFQAVPISAWDSEVPILETLALRLTPASTGTINLFTERAACGSCWGIAEQFMTMFPKIELVIGAWKW